MESLFTELTNFGLDQNKINRTLFVLRTIYIADSIGYFGAVLGSQFDTEYSTEIDILRRLGLIVHGIVHEGREDWFAYSRCTDSGDKIGKGLLERYIEENKNKLVDHLKQIPGKFLSFWLQFGVEPIFYGSSKFRDRGMQWKIQGATYFVPLRLSSMQDILTDPGIADKILALWEGLASLGFAVKTTDSVSTRGGALGDITYVLPPDVIDVIKTEVVELREDEIKDYAVFGALKMYKSDRYYGAYYDRSKFLEVLALLGLREADIESSVNEMYELGLTSRYSRSSKSAPFLILNSTGYDKYIMERFFEPVKAALERAETTPKPLEKKEAILPPGKPFSASLKLKEILTSSKGYVKIIDSYVNDKTLEFLLDIPENLPIKVLAVYTGDVKKEKKFRSSCQRFTQERPQFELRKSDKDLIHDRFILSQDKGWSIGTSIKDAGKKLSMISELSAEAKDEIEKFFESIWAKSRKM